MNNQTKEDNLKLLKNELLSKAEKINEDCGKEFIRISISSVIGTSPAIDSYSTWLLAGCGAIAALMVNNVKSIAPLLGNNGFKISIYLLVCSVVAGLFQKYRSLCIQSFTALSNELINGSNSLNSIQQQAFQELYQEAQKNGIQIDVKPAIDINKIKNEFSNLLPFFLHRKALMNFEKGAEDHLHGWRKMIKSFKHQIAYFILQFLFFIIFLVFAASAV